MAARKGSFCFYDGMALHMLFALRERDLKGEADAYNGLMEKVFEEECRKWNPEGGVLALEKEGHLFLRNQGKRMDKDVNKFKI